MKSVVRKLKKYQQDYAVGQGWDLNKWSRFFQLVDLPSTERGNSRNLFRGFTRSECAHIYARWLENEPCAFLTPAEHEYLRECLYCGNIRPVDSDILSQNQIRKLSNRITCKIFAYYESEAGYSVYTDA